MSENTEEKLYYERNYNFCVEGCNINVFIKALGIFLRTEWELVKLICLWRKNLTYELNHKMTVLIMKLKLIVFLESLNNTVKLYTYNWTAHSFVWFSGDFTPLSSLRSADPSFESREPDNNSWSTSHYFVSLITKMYFTKSVAVINNDNNNHVTGKRKKTKT